MRRWRDERGAVATTELVILFPVVLGLVWLALSAALFFYSRSVATAAAQAGAMAGAAERAGVADCEAAAAQMASAAGDALQNVTIRCSRTATRVQVTVTGRSLSLVPGWSPQLSQTVAVPVERLTR